MPQQRVTLLGNTWERTPWDDAEAQQVQAQNAWNSAQHQNNWQNQRFNKQQFDARGMNQDNLNFNVWNSGQADKRDLRSIEAQARLQRDRLLHNENLFNLGWDKDEAMEDRRNKRDDEIYNLRRKPYQDRQLAGIDLQNKLAQENADFNKSERQRLIDLRKAEEDWLNGTPGQKFNEDGEYNEDGTPAVPAVPGFKQRVADGLTGDALLADLATRPGGSVADMAPLLGMQQQNAQFQANRILADLRSDNPALRTRGLQAAEAAPPEIKRLLGSIPDASEMPAIDLNALPEDQRNAAQNTIQNTIEDANVNGQGTIFGEHGTPSAGEIEQHVQALRARINGMAAASPGLSKAQVWRNIKDKLDTGGWSWNPTRGFGAFDAPVHDKNEEAIRRLDAEFGDFK